MSMPVFQLTVLTASAGNAGSSDGTLTAIGIILGFILLVAAAIRYSEGKKDKKPEDGTPAGGKAEPENAPAAPLTPRLTGSLIKKLGLDQGREADAGPKEKTLDMIFAEANGKWVCPQCEIIHGGEESICAVCGFVRKE